MGIIDNARVFSLYIIPHFSLLAALSIYLGGNES